MLRQKILDVAVDIARARGLPCITRLEVARRADAAPATINYHFQSMEGLRNAVIEQAIQYPDFQDNLRIIAEALAQRHQLALRAPDALRKRAAQHILKG